MKPTENIAVVDIGSNTLRLLIGNIRKNKICRVYTDRVVTRLGKNLEENGYIKEEAIEDSINALKSFKKLSETFNVSCIIAVGTSALREAKNSSYFCEKVKESTGINVHIISGEEEAYYTLCGIMNEELEKEHSLFIVDIGGGSTEWIEWKDQTFSIGSIPIGAIKIKEKFLNTDSYFEENIESARQFIEKKISIILPKVKIRKFIASGGTASTLAMINFGLSTYQPKKTHMSEIDVIKFKMILKNLLSISIQERKKIKGMPADRADIICAGLIILEKIIDYLNVERLTISEYGILEGIMKNYKKFCYNNPL